MKARFLYGLILGLLLPAIAYLLTNYTHIIADMMPQKPLGLYVLALAGNMVGVWYLYRHNGEELGKGIVLATFLSMLFAVITKTVVI